MKRICTYILIGLAVLFLVPALPVTARTPTIKNISIGDNVFVNEKGLDLRAVFASATGNVSPTALRKFVNDDPTKALIWEIPIADASDFDALPPLVNGQTGIYYAYNPSQVPYPGSEQANNRSYLVIRTTDLGLDVVLNASHVDSIGGKHVSRGTRITFKISAPLVGSYYKYGSTYPGRATVYVTGPDGITRTFLGSNSVNLENITLNSPQLYTDTAGPGSAINLSIPAGTYTAVLKFSPGQDFYNQTGTDSNAITFTVDPVMGRTPTIRDIASGDYVFVYERGLNLSSLDAGGGNPPMALRRFVDDDVTKAIIKEIPVADPADFDVLSGLVGGQTGIYFPYNPLSPNSGGRKANPDQSISIMPTDLSLGVYLTNHADSVDGKSLLRTTNITFQISAPYVGTYYRIAGSPSLYMGQADLWITLPNGTEVTRFGFNNVNLAAINITGPRNWSDVQRGPDPIMLSGLAPGTYRATLRFSAGQDFYLQPDTDSNTVTFTIASGRTPMIRTINNGDHVFVHETGLDITNLSASGTSSVVPTSLRKFVDDDVTKAIIREIPVADAAHFAVLSGLVGQEYGVYYPCSNLVTYPGGAKANGAQSITIRPTDLSLGVYENAIICNQPSRGGSVDGTGLIRSMNITFRIGAPEFGTFYRIAGTPDVYPGQADLWITFPNGTRVSTFGSNNVNLGAINITGPDNWTDVQRGPDPVMLRDLPVGTYSATLMFSAGQDFYLQPDTDSNTVTFTILSGSVALLTNKGSVARGGTFVVTITGESNKAYFLYVRSTGLSPDQVPVIDGWTTNAQPMVNNTANYTRPQTYQGGVSGIGYICDLVPNDVDGCSTNPPMNPDSPHNLPNNRTYAVATTQTDGTRSIQFSTNSTTRAMKYTIKAVDPADAGNYGLVNVTVMAGQVTITPGGNGSYLMGDIIRLTGTNSDSRKVYLFLKGPGLGDAGASLSNVTVPAEDPCPADDTCWKVVPVNVDNTWSSSWDTSDPDVQRTLEAGTYTIYAVSANATGVATSLADKVYSSAPVLLMRLPVAGFTATPISGTAPLAVNFFDTSTAGYPDTYTYWFGEGTSSSQKNPVFTYNTSGMYSVSHSACNAAGCSWLNRSSYIQVQAPHDTILIGGGSGYTGTGIASAPPAQPAAPAGDSQDTGQTGAAPPAGSTSDTGAQMEAPAEPPEVPTPVQPTPTATTIGISDLTAAVGIMGATGLFIRRRR